MQINVALIDDDQLVLQLMASFLNQQKTIAGVRLFNSGNAFIEELAKNTFSADVALVDLKMENGSGIETIQYLQENHPSIKTVVLSSYYKPSFTGNLLKHGASAFLSKETDKEDLVHVIEEVYKKGHYLSAEQVFFLRNQISPKVPKTTVSIKEKLSVRELEILHLICNQFTAKEIAEKLFLSIKTVETHKSNLLLKTATKNTAGLVIYAIQQHLINPDDFVVLD